MAFRRYIGIDYSGAQTPTASLKGLRVYLAEGDAWPRIPPPVSRRRYWSRRGVAEFHQLAHRGDADLDRDRSRLLVSALRHGLKLDWAAFLDDFQRHWPTNEGSRPMLISCAVMERLETVPSALAMPAVGVA